MLVKDLQNLLSFPSSEKVKLIFNDRIYIVNKSFAVMISPDFYQQLIKNPFLNCLKLEINNNFIDNIIQGKDIDSDSLLDIALKLKNDLFFREWKYQKGPLSVENCQERLNYLLKLNVPIEWIKDELNFIQNNFQECKNLIDFNTISFPYLIEILHNIKNIEKENNILETVKLRLKYEKSDDNKSILLNCIDIKRLSERQFWKLINDLKFENINENIWNYATTLLNEHRQKLRYLQ